MSTPMQSQRVLRSHTPLMSDRKKALFGSSDSRSSRNYLPALHSESDSDNDDRSLGVAALDTSSSCDERDPSPVQTPSHSWRETRSHTRRLLKENQDMFIKSPYMLRNFQKHFHNSGSESMPATPREHHNQLTPSSSHSTASAHTVSSGCGRARRSLASLIADTESCSSSLKDLNFDTDSGTDTKENSPKKSTRKSNRIKKSTAKFASFKGVLAEHEKNVPMECSSLEVISPTQMMKTPHSTSEVASPPRLSHSRRNAIEIDESPECGQRSNKRPYSDCTSTDKGPHAKMAKLDNAPKARLSLFNSEKLKEILSAKSFYGKTPEIPQIVASKVSQVVFNESIPRRHLSHSRRQQRKPGQINMGVRHNIRKPKLPRYSTVVKLNMPRPLGMKPLSATSGQSTHSTMLLDDKDKPDPFDKEHETIDALLSQWTEEEVPTSEPRLYLTMEEADAKIRRAETLLCFNKNVIEEDNILVDPNEPVPVAFVETPDTSVQQLTDLDAIDKQLADVDNQLATIAKQNNIDPEHLLSCDLAGTNDFASTVQEKESPKMFPIFTSKAKSQNPSSSTKGAPHKPKIILKGGRDQYVIDAGQKKFGATQCKECGVIYQIGDPQDEHDHLVHHNAEDVLRFNGWREESVVGVWGESRCVCIRGNQESRWRKVALLLETVVHPQLGYAGPLPRSDRLSAYTAYLYIEKKRIVGCLIAEPKDRAHRLVLDGGIECCSEEAYPVKCGISRIWTHVSHRRRGVATRLLNCARKSFLYGHILGAGEIAFSAPTPAGRALAAAYTDTQHFGVYLD